MKSTSTAVVVCLMLSAGQAALAGTNDILIGLDEKITYGPDGLVNGPPGKEAVLVMDVSNPAKPRIRASLPLMNSLLGPPTNLQITPDGNWSGAMNSTVQTVPPLTPPSGSPNLEAMVGAIKNWSTTPLAPKTASSKVEISRSRCCRRNTRAQTA